MKLEGHKELYILHVYQYLHAESVLIKIYKIQFQLHVGWGINISDQ